MSKQGMSRPDRTQLHPKHAHPPVPEIQGKAKHGKAHVRPIIAGTEGPNLKVFHTDVPIPKPDILGYFDSDLAKENLQRNLTEADKQDFKKS